MKWLRYPLRTAIMGVAAVCAVWGILSGAGLWAVFLGAVVGGFVGEILGRSRFNVWFMGIAFLMVALLARVFSLWATEYEYWPDLVGPGSAIKMATVVNFSLLTFAGIAFLRTLSVRKAGFQILEMVVIVGALSLLFQGHRHGEITRPLWLADWAWRNGYDPSSILFLVGGGAVLLLAVMMLLESPKEVRISFSSWAAFPVVAVLFMGIWQVSSCESVQEPPRASNGLGVTHESKGDPPKNTPPKNNKDDRSGDGKGGGGGGGEPQPPDINDPTSTGGKANMMAVVILGDDYNPPAGMFYFRQKSWSAFNGARLVESQETFDRDIPREFPSAKESIAQGDVDFGRTLIHTKVVMLVDHPTPFFLGIPTSMAPLNNPDPDRFVRAYAVESMAQSASYMAMAGRSAGSATWNKETWAHYTKESTDPRFSFLANDIVSTLPEQKRGDPFIAALKIKQYLDNELTYSTKHRHANVPDPTADFLFGVGDDRRIGYCVHFAHTAVFLWRALGIPARVSVGYAVDPEARQGATIPIMGNAAHAWPELYLDGVGWLILDIQAKKNLDEAEGLPERRQTLLLGDLALKDPPTPLNGENTRNQPPPLGALGLLFLAIVVGVVVAIFYGVKVWRRLAPSFATQAERSRLSFRLALDLMAEAGLSRHFGETRESFARRYREVGAFQTMTGMHVATRFGAYSFSPALHGKEEWNLLLRQCRQQLSGRNPWWKRTLSILNPFSFLKSR